MTYQARRPGAATRRASSQLSRFSRNRLVNTAIWQTKSREQLEAAARARNGAHGVHGGERLVRAVTGVSAGGRRRVEAAWGLWALGGVP
jgi:hypothetical protein